MASIAVICPLDLFCVYLRVWFLIYNRAANLSLWILTNVHTVFIMKSVLQSFIWHTQTPPILVLYVFFLLVSLNLRLLYSTPPPNTTFIIYHGIATALLVLLPSLACANLETPFVGAPMWSDLANNAKITSSRYTRDNKCNFIVNFFLCYLENNWNCMHIYNSVHILHILRNSCNT